MACEWVMDVPSTLDVVLGTSTLTVGACSRLAVGDIVRLKQAAGADLELRLAGLPFAAGEVAVVDDAVSIRVGRILKPEALA
jgi:flagellar motor switch/type III secretory pathway protein FliN